MSTELPKAYDPKEAQAKWLAVWAEKGYFHSEPDPAKKPYTIVIPPPNVTGALHMGHALNNTLQDVLIRWRRMQGYNALWIPGTDHAGIATQAVVEKRVMQTEGLTRHQLGPEKLVERIWQWKDQYEQRILGQLKQMGASCDFERTRFTLDEQCAKAVRETFFRMFCDGYIYRGKRLVNWDTQLQTSVADDETYTEDTKGGFWTFKYPVTREPGASATGEPEYIRFSTTRPETMLGDTAVCVHPSDERYQHLIGKTVTIPLNGRTIPIIADHKLADPKLGTGCVKVTPAHDPNDYECWVRHPEIGQPINVMTPDGKVCDGHGQYSGLDFETAARDAVIQDMENLGFFEGREDRLTPKKFSDRSKTPIQPYLSDQWFVMMGDRDDGNSGLAQLAIDAVESGRVKFYPERYRNSYLDWLKEKRDWCVSRQLWWGHRIAVWKPTESSTSVFERNKKIDDLRNRYPDKIWAHPFEFLEPSHNGEQLVNVTLLVCIASDAADLEREVEQLGFIQDDDVLDTWFSSALWPHSTLGWPEQTPELQYYYPTSVLCTSRDIITLWVARMVLTGLYNVGKAGTPEYDPTKVPFHHVYIHPKVMDGFGEGMSKTKGNGVDPLDVIDLYGTDAMRYGMVSLATETQDSRMPVTNICPHCGAQVPVKQEHMYMRTKKLACPTCKQPFRPGGPWPSDDPDLKTAKQGSDRFEVGRNFANKLWNATRFLLMNLEGYTPADVNLAELPTEDRWIVSRLATTTAAVTDALENYRFADVSRLIYEFTWSEFCDWYIEMSKGRLRDADARPLVQRVLAGVLDGILRLVHPVMPFVAESLWQALNEAAPERGLPTPIKGEESVVIARWPEYPTGLADAKTEAAIARMQDLVRGVREIRNRYQLDKADLDLFVKASPTVAAELNGLAVFVQGLARVKTFTCSPDVAKPKQAGSVVHADFEAYVPLAGLIDPAAEVKRTEKQIADLRKQLGGIQGKLSNESYRKNAPAEVVAESEAKVAELEGQLRVLEGNLHDLQEA